MFNLDRRNRLIFLSGWGAFLVGNLSQALAPIIVQALKNHMALVASKAGYLVSVEFAGIALTALIVAPFIDKLPKRRIAVVGCLLAVMAHIISSQGPSYALLLFVRFFAGLFAGAALAAGGAVIAGAAAPDRMFALVKTFNAMIMAIMVWLAGYAVKGYGVGGGYGVLALLTLCTLPLLCCFPNTVKEKQADNKKIRLPHFILGCLTIFAILNWIMVVSAPWAYLAIMGETAGLAVEQVSGILGAGFIFGMLGGLLAAWLNLRFGRIVPVVIGVLVNGGTWFLICTVPDPFVYTISVLLNNISYFFAVAYLLGTAARLDQEGRWASIASTSFLGAIAVAPALGGLIIDNWNTMALGGFTFAGELLTAFIIIIVVKQLAAIEGSKATESW